MGGGWGDEVFSNQKIQWEAAGEGESCPSALFRDVLNRKLKTSCPQLGAFESWAGEWHHLASRVALEAGALAKRDARSKESLGGRRAQLFTVGAAFQGPSAPSQRNACAWEPLDLSVPYLAVGLSPLQICFHS